MISLDHTAVRQLLSWPELVDALRDMFVSKCEAPVRLHYDVGVADVPGNLLVMPAWLVGQYIGVKVTNVFPGNGVLNLPTISSVYLLSDGRTGRLLAQIEGGELTARRTAAASALAARYLSRPDSRTLLVVGTGRVCSNLVPAYCAIRPIERVLVYGRNPQKASDFAERVGAALPARFEVAPNIAGALAETDIVTAATLSSEPLIHGRDLPPGIHVDLVGGFRPTMREADNAVIERAEGIFVDILPGALAEAGDIIRPIEEGVLTAEGIAADLHELCGGIHPGRRRADEITVFKSVGASIEDLAAAVALVEQSRVQQATGGPA